jgi:hypothetical protein
VAGGAIGRGRKIFAAFDQRGIISGVTDRHNNHCAEKAKTRRNDLPHALVASRPPPL